MSLSTISMDWSPWEGSLSIPAEISVLSVVGNKFFLVEEEPNSVHYRAMSTTDPTQVAAEVFISCSTKGNLYANTCVPRAQQLPGITGRNVYVRVILYGRTTDSLTGATYTVPILGSTNYTVPDGAPIGDAPQLLVSALASAIDSCFTKANVVDAASHCVAGDDFMRMAQGAVRKFA